MKSIASSYVFYYNKKYGRIGHLFQDRFRSEPCNTPEYFFTLFRYIHQNPVKARLVKLAQDYPYSSWPNDYLSLGQERVCFTRAAVKRFGLDELAAWVDDPLPENVGCIDMDERKVVADELVRDLLLQKVVRGTSQSSDCSTKNDKKNMYAKSCLNSRQDPDRCHASPDYPTELFSISKRDQGSWGQVV